MNYSQTVDRINKVFGSILSAKQIDFAEVYCTRLVSYLDDTVTGLDGYFGQRGMLIELDGLVKSKVIEALSNDGLKEC